MLSGIGLNGGVVHAGDELCEHGVHLVGPADLTSGLPSGWRTALRAGPCARVTLLRVPAGVRVELVRGERRIRREVATLADAAFWLETWLVVPGGLPGPSAGDGLPSTDSVPPASARRVAEEWLDDERPPRFAEPEPASRHGAGRWELAAQVRLAVDEVPDTWLGPELALAVVVEDIVWVGGLLGAGWTVPGRDGDARNDLRAALRGGLVSAPDDVVVRGGLGLGFYTGWSATSGEGGGETNYRDGGPFGELSLELSVRLFGPLRLLGGADVRLSFVDPPEAASGEHMSAPTSLPVFQAAARAGLAVDFGDAR